MGFCEIIGVVLRPKELEEFSAEREGSRRPLASFIVCEAAVGSVIVVGAEGRKEGKKERRKKGREEGGYGTNLICVKE